MNAKRVDTLLLVFLLIIVATAATAAPTGAEVEPNNSMEQATTITMGESTGRIDPVGDLDFFRFEAEAGQRMRLAAKSGCDNLNTEMVLYDAEGNQLAADQDEGNRSSEIAGFLIPANGSYYVRVAGQPYTVNGQAFGDYVLQVRPYLDDEWNDWEHPTEISYGSVTSDAYDLPNDYDYYEFEGLAGDVVDITITYDRPGYEARIWLDHLESYSFSAGSDEPSQAVRVTAVLPLDGRYRITTQGPEDWWYCGTTSWEPTPYQLSLVRRSLYIVGAKKGKVGGISFGPNDVLANDSTGKWRRVFDGEDVGLNVPLSGVEVFDDGSLLLALARQQQLSGLGLVKPQDVVRFVPSSIGENTAGSFTWYLRGAQAGLSTAGERIDAIALTPNGDLLLSTTGSASVPKMGGGKLGSRDEDLLQFHPSGPLPSSGTWSMYMDGTSYLPKFGAENIRGASVPPAQGYNSTLLFTLQNAFQFTSWVSGTGYKKVTAKAGDMLWMLYWSDTWDTYEDTQIILKKDALGFPRVITSLSIGPGWEQ